MSVSTVLVIVFVVLKLIGVVDWSWWWVFSPWVIDVVLYLILRGLIELVDSANGVLDRRHARKSITSYRHDTSHIQPLDSIKNPRNS